MLRLDREFRSRDMKARVVMMIHDSISVEVREEEAGHVQDLIRIAMNGAAELDAPLEIDFQ